LVRNTQRCLVPEIAFRATGTQKRNKRAAKCSCTHVGALPLDPARTQSAPYRIQREHALYGSPERSIASTRQSKNVPPSSCCYCRRQHGLVTNSLINARCTDGFRSAAAVPAETARLDWDECMEVSARDSKAAVAPDSGDSEWPEGECTGGRSNPQWLESGAGVDDSGWRRLAHAGPAFTGPVGTHPSARALRQGSPRDPCWKMAATVTRQGHQEGNPVPSQAPRSARSLSCG
jgi:hypothetical protein